MITLNVLSITTSMTWLGSALVSRITRANLHMKRLLGHVLLGIHRCRLHYLANDQFLWCVFFIANKASLLYDLEKLLDTRFSTFFSSPLFHHEFFSGCDLNSLLLIFLCTNGFYILNLTQYNWLAGFYWMQEDLVILWRRQPYIINIYSFGLAPRLRAWNSSAVQSCLFSIWPLCTVPLSREFRPCY